MCIRYRYRYVIVEDKHQNMKLQEQGLEGMLKNEGSKVQRLEEERKMLQNTLVSPVSEMLWLEACLFLLAMACFSF